MSLLNYARDERVVIVGLTTAIVGVVATVRMLLTQIRDKAEIKPPQPTTQYITQETEDSLKPSTLDTILGHYNYAIREIAAKIVCDRAVNDGESLDYLLWGITRPDYDERMKCLRTLSFITDPRTNHHHHICRRRKGGCGWYPLEAYLGSNMKGCHAELSRPHFRHLSVQCCVPANGTNFLYQTPCRN